MNTSPINHATQVMNTSRPQIIRTTQINCTPNTSQINHTPQINHTSQEINPSVPLNLDEF